MGPRHRYGYKKALHGITELYLSLSYRYQIICSDSAAEVASVVCALRGPIKSNYRKLYRSLSWFFTCNVYDRDVPLHALVYFHHNNYGTGPARWPTEVEGFEILAAKLSCDIYSYSMFSSSSVLQA